MEPNRLVIDMRSDTVTKPTDGMRRAMAEAEVGDDCFGDDRTAKTLEGRWPGLGNEDSVYMATGTMTNQVAIRADTEGFDAAPLYDSDETMARQLLASGHPSLEGITLEELKTRGWMRLNYPDPFVPFAAGFPSASGKLEFVSERMAQAGLDPVAGYTPAHEASQRDTTLARKYPLALIAPANHYFLNSMFANVPRQRQRAGAATLAIHPDDAAPRGIMPGDEVRVANARGSFFAVAEVSDRVRPGVVATTKGRWPCHSKQGTTVNATVAERDSDMGGGAVYHDNRVEVEAT